MVAVVYTTIDSEQDARKIAHILVEEQIVACVNIIPNVESIYRWKGNIEEERNPITTLLSSRAFSETGPRIIAITNEKSIALIIGSIEIISPNAAPANAA